jgi:ABC-2 type transport system ATP-binding protein
VLAIDVADLRKTYAKALAGSRGGHEALRGVDLAVARGTAFGLIGLNGAGKTTFIKILLGVVRPTTGAVRVLGGSPEDIAVRRRIGYLPERLHLPQHLCGRAFLASVARLKGLRGAAGEVSRQLGRVGLAGDAERRIGGYSKGMRQRLGLAAALLGAPDLLVLDEPTDGVDPLGRAEVRRILAEERARGATVFLNSHLLAETERVCDRFGILHAGRLVRQGTLAELSGSGPRWRVRFAPGADAAALVRMGFAATESADVFLCEAADAVTLDERLQRARGAGALLIELQHQGRDLEDVLAEAVGAAA